jgi:hypothetical protein
LVDVLLQDRRVPPAELGRIARKQPSVIEHEPLPLAGPLRYVTTRPRALEGFCVVGKVLVEEGDELGAEGLDVGVEGQLHSAPAGRKFEGLLL